MTLISTRDHWENPSVQVWGRTGETNKKQTDLAGDLFETAIQTIPNDLCITFTTSGTLRATITRLYQAQKEATVRLLLTGITEDCIDTAINQLPFRRFIRVWCHPDVNSAILRIMLGCRHEVASRTFFHYIANAVQDIPNHSPTSIKGVGSTRFHSTPGQRSKEGDEGIKCRTRAGRDNWPNVMLEVGCSEPLSQLRIDAEWWLVSSKGATNMVIIIQISQQPDALDLEVWKMKPNPSRLTRSSPAEIPFCASTIHVDAHGALTPPNATLTVSYTALFDLPTPYAPDIVITTQQLREISASIFEE